MEYLYFERVRELKTERENLERKLNVKIDIKGKKVIIEGSSIDEYDALIVLEAMQFGFSAKEALTLLDEDFVFDHF